MTTSPLRMPPAFVGDLSTQDAAALATMADGRRVLEFGAGGSTQIFAEVAFSVVTMETDGDWIIRTQRNVDMLGRHGVHFMHYNLEALQGTGPYDLIFVDGESSKREAFAFAAFEELAYEGLLVFHDSRTGERAIVLRVALERMFCVGEIFFDIAGSNLAAIRKRPMPAYANWNIDEGRAPWEYGGGFDEPPDGFVAKVVERSESFYTHSYQIPVPPRPA